MNLLLISIKNAIATPAVQRCTCCEKHGLHLRDKRANSPFPAETGCPFGEQVLRIAECQPRSILLANSKANNFNGFQSDYPGEPTNGSSDQPQTSLRLACRDWSGTNESLGVCSRDATINRLIVDSVGHGVRQRYRAGR